MYGPEGTADPPAHLAGIIPRSVTHLFERIEQDKSLFATRCTMSFVQIYAGTDFLP